MLWQWQRGSRSLIQNLTAVSEKIHIDIVHSKDDNIVAPGGLGSSAVDTDVAEEDIEIPEIMEEVIEFLLAGLRDKVSLRIFLDFMIRIFTIDLMLFVSTSPGTIW